MQKEVPAPPDPAEPLVAPERTLVMPVAGASAAFQASASADRRMWLAGGLALAAMAPVLLADQPRLPPRNHKMMSHQMTSTIHQLI